MHRKLLICFLLFLSPQVIEAKKRLSVASITSPMSPTIVLDAGHGGSNRGTRSKTPYCEEKRLCLQTARLAKKYLDQLGLERFTPAEALGILSRVLNRNPVQLGASRVNWEALAKLNPATSKSPTYAKVANLESGAGTMGA